MATTTIHAQTMQERMYSFIGDAGAVTPRELVAFLAEEDFRADEWLRAQMEEGRLHRDEFGRYGTSCAWPRVGF